MLGRENIVIKGARAHNLKNIDVTIPRDKFVVLTGLSGSGKSSLAFDTIYAEGQRRYVESLSAYARQFLGQMDKPDVDSIEGLSPAISIDQKTTSRNPRSTVGTVTEIYDYLRLLYARIGHPHCPEHGIEITSQTVEQMVDRIMQYPERTRLQILAPVISGNKGEHKSLFSEIAKQGFVRVRVDGEQRDLSENIELEKNKKHTIEVIVDRIVVKEDARSRLADSIETALKMSGGQILVDIIGQEELRFSSNYACPICGFSIEELSPRMFSFNSPYGACPECDGLGVKMIIDKDLLITDPSKSIEEGAFEAWAGGTSNYYPQFLRSVCEHFNIPQNVPVSELTEDQMDKLLYGTGDVKVRFRYENDFGMTRDAYVTFEGIIPNLERRYRETASEGIREFIEQFMGSKPCGTCHGHRLKKEVLAVTVNDQNIAHVTSLSIGEAQEFFGNLELTDKEKSIAHLILKEINNRLGFLVNVGLDYLTLSRAAGTLSGGEAQRIRLATQIGSSLMGVLYILDEPSIGLHQRDNDKLISALTHMRDLGNTLIVVEHDEDTMLAADHIIDIGPGAGIHGGQVISQGTPQEIMNDPRSLTGQYLSGKKFIPVPLSRRKPDGRWLEIKGAKENNLKNINVKVPIGVFTAVTGVSGSGKSTLVNEILYKTLARDLNRARVRPGQYKEIKGLEHVEKVADIDHAKAEALYKAFQDTKFPPPPTDCLAPIGVRQLLAGMLKGVRAEFYAASSREAAIYRGRPFQIEAAIAFGGELPADDPARVIRFANRVPLLYQQSACSSFKAVVDTNWRNYDLNQPRGSAPVGPLVIMIHMASVWVPFTSESKEAIADYDEIRKEMKLALMECGRKLATYVRKRQRMKREGERRDVFERYIGEIVKAVTAINGADPARLYEQLLEQARARAAAADQVLDEEGRVVKDKKGREDASDDEGVIIVESARRDDEHKPRTELNDRAARVAAELASGAFGDDQLPILDGEPSQIGRAHA